MLKRSFWLALAVVAGLIVWRWLQQRRDDFGGLAPQLGSFESPPWPAPAPPAPLAQTAPQIVKPAADVAEVAEPEAEAAPVATEVAEPEAEAAPVAAEAAPETAEAAEPAAAPEAAETTPEPEEQPDALDGVVGYCVRCKTKRTIKDAHEETTESGRRAARGTCPVCGANMFTFLATD